MMKMDLNSTKRLGWQLVWGSALLASLPAMIGCQQRRATENGEVGREMRFGEQFPRNDEPRQMHRMAEAQAAAGARADGTLHLCHFDAGGTPGALNSLGEEKLDLMLVADASLPLVVYLNLAKDDAYPAREQAVRIYLKDRGLSDGQVTLTVGPNVRNTSPAAPRLKAAEAVEGSATAGSTPSGGATTGGMTAK